MNFQERIIANTVLEGELELLGRTFHFRILKREMETNLPSFVGILADETLIISEDVPARYIRHFFEHEIICCVRLKGIEGRCVRALKQEISKVPKEIRREYIAFRLSFFRNLALHYKNSDSENLKKEIQGSLIYLKKLSRKIGLK